MVNKDRQPMPGVAVALIPNSRQYAMFRSAVTEQSGSFRFRAVPAGKHKLLAWAEVERGAWYAPEFVKPFERRAKKVSVKKDDRLRITLKAISPEHSK